MLVVCCWVCSSSLIMSRIKWIKWNLFNTSWLQRAAAVDVEAVVVYEVLDSLVHSIWVHHYSLALP